MQGKLPLQTSDQSHKTLGLYCASERNSSNQLLRLKLIRYHKHIWKLINTVGISVIQCHANYFINIVGSCSITPLPPLRTNILATALRVKDILSLQWEIKFRLSCFYLRFNRGQWPCFAILFKHLYSPCTDNVLLGGSLETYWTLLIWIIAIIGSMLVS